MRVVWLACSRKRELGLCCQDSRGTACSPECHQYVVLEAARWNGQAACPTNSYVCCSLAAHAKGLLKFSMQQKFTLQSCALQREALA